MKNRSDAHIFNAGLLVSQLEATCVVDSPSALLSSMKAAQSKVRVGGEKPSRWLHR